MAVAISELMTQHHQECDGYFASAENAVAQGKWDQAAGLFQQFENALILHLRREEDILFPAFETETGQTGGPTQMMRMEHEQMRALAQNLKSACEAGDKDGYLGNSETLLVLMQQHNMKEEQILYPMMDRALDADADVLVAEVTSLD